MTNMTNSVLPRKHHVWAGRLGLLVTLPFAIPLNLVLGKRLITLEKFRWLWKVAGDPDALRVAIEKKG
jgi:hypothetical protein